GTQPQFVAITPDDAIAYVTNAGSNNVTPITVTTRTAAAPIVVGTSPRGIAIRNSATAVSTDVSLTKTASASSVAAGNNLTYTLTASNSGSRPATGVTVTDPLPAGMSFVSATPSQGSCVQAAGTVTCSLGGLVASSSATVALVVTPTSALGPTT